MTTSTQVTKPVNFHENFVKAPEVTEKQIEKLAAFGYDEEFTKLFVAAVNWIAINDNKRKSMKFFKKNQPLVDAKVAETFEEDGQVYMRLTAKADKIMQGKVNKINVSQLPRQRVKQTKGYVATATIPAAVQNFLDSAEFVVKSTKLMKPTYNVTVGKEGKRGSMLVVIYEHDVKLVFVGGKKFKDRYESVLAKMDQSIVDNHKSTEVMAFIQVSQDNLDKVTAEMVDFE